ncbi:helix-turn-helix domain-containing protein [Lysinibacillus fusiformis]|uniref:helix-turn-helix domain-containing protein n=1 Tax=Lysinibacillus fusiformis TaxID=28031 RepID=UPI000D343264|nr:MULTISPECIES: helix-turn-helix transcriptional regulator [Lysinibacillus]MED4668989.1 helix-turn-helix transcriptional regulator [Lysinibacillus fusiformis]QAS57266.1 hypothetical protein LSP_13405 [Lysinibacillus sphaericus]RDV24965.1 hypothetical protein C7B90_23130 [Lysinibacillus fusiformis]
MHPSHTRWSFFIHPVSKLKTFGDYLKKYRLENDLNISEFHRLTGVSQPYLSLLEASEKVPSKKIIEKLSHGMAENPLVRAAIEAEMLELAGYKPLPKKSNQQTKDYLKEIEEGRLIRGFEEEIRELSIELSNLKSKINLNYIFEENPNFQLDGTYLNKKELIALKYFLLGLRAIREDT